ncbi:MAG TPA: hypothetical protein DCE41_22555 [Cytophagales bacterium]|nr:hypothetical protein [Cytophagales bacterium]HAP62272.1 hypothetical protein [Cytophagales bacterium]
MDMKKFICLSLLVTLSLSASGQGLDNPEWLLGNWKEIFLIEDPEATAAYASNTQFHLQADSTLSYRMVWYVFDSQSRTIHIDIEGTWALAGNELKMTCQAISIPEEDMPSGRQEYMDFFCSEFNQSAPLKLMQVTPDYLVYFGQDVGQYYLANRVEANAVAGE